MEVSDLWPKLNTSLYCGQERMNGKVVIVTGASSGIGLETAKELARRGARVIIGCRDVQRGLDAQEEIIHETANNEVYFRQLDLARLDSVRNFAFGIIQRERRLDVLINNAGICKQDNSLTVDGLPIESQVNHFGPFLLTLILTPMLVRSAPSRIINVTSTVHFIGVLDPERFDKCAITDMEHLLVYANSKLANVMFTHKLSRLLKSYGVTVNCLHPGLVHTNLYRNRTPLRKELMEKLFKSPWEGSQTSVYLAVAPEVAGVTGNFFVDCQPHECSQNSKDPATIDKLWDLSERRVQWFYSNFTN